MLSFFLHLYYFSLLLLQFCNFAKGLSNLRENYHLSSLHNTSFRPTCYVSNFASGELNPLPLYPTKCVHILVLAKGLIALMVFQFQFQYFLSSICILNISFFLKIILVFIFYFNIVSLVVFFF